MRQATVQTLAWARLAPRTDRVDRRRFLFAPARDFALIASSPSVVAVETPARKAMGKKIRLHTVDSKKGWVMLTAIEAATAAVYGPPCRRARYARKDRTARYGSDSKPPI